MNTSLFILARFDGIDQADKDREKLDGENCQIEMFFFCQTERNQRCEVILSVYYINTIGLNKSTYLPRGSKNYKINKKTKEHAILIFIA